MVDGRARHVLQGRTPFLAGKLADYWDCSVFLDVERDVANERMALRYGTSADSLVGQNPRYVEGQRIYLETCHPSRVATIVIDDNDLARPHIIR